MRFVDGFLLVLVNVAVVGKVGLFSRDFGSTFNVVADGQFTVPYWMTLDGRMMIGKNVYILGFERMAARLLQPQFLKVSSTASSLSARQDDFPPGPFRLLTCPALLTTSFHRRRRKE